LNLVNKNQYIYAVLSVICLILFFRLFTINNGMLTDSYVNLIISQNLEEFFVNTPSGVFNENLIYPLLIKIFSIGFNPLTSPIIINFLALFGASCFLFKICLKYSESLIASFLTALFFIINPIILFWVARPMPDILFCFFAVLFFYIAIFTQNRLLKILVFTVLCLIRTEGILLIPLFFINKKFKTKDFIYIAISVSILIIVFFVFNLGGGINFKIAFDNIKDIDIKNNLFKHINSFFYVFQIPVMIFLGAGLLYLFKFEKNNRKFFYIFIPVIIYFGMNVFWKYVQFRHYIPFIPFLLILICVFFKYMIKETEKFSRHLTLFLILFVLYTCFDIYKVSYYRIENSKNVMQDVYEAGIYAQEQNYPIIASNINDVLKYFDITNNLIIFDDWETILENIEKNDIYFILSQYRLSKFPEFEFLEEIKIFKSNYKVFYPCVPCEQYENTWNWEIMKGKQVDYKTVIYKLNRIAFLSFFIQNALDLKDFALSAFYCDKMLNISKKLDENSLKEIKKIYYMAAMTAKNSQSKLKFGKKALNINVESDIDENLEYLLNSK